MIDYLRKIKFNKRKELQAHCLGWMLFIIYDAVIGGMVKGSFGGLGNYIVHYIINISLFYFHSLILLPLALRSPAHSIWRLPFLLGIELLLYECIIYGVDSFLLTYTSILEIKGLHLDKNFILAYIWRGLYFMLFSTAYYFFRRYKVKRDQYEALKQSEYEITLQKESLEKSIAEAKSAFLLAQINPHFLFNTLNFIYYTTAKTSPESAESIMLLSRIMRYSSDLKNATETISLEKEVEYVRWLMELHQKRFKENFNVQFSCSCDFARWEIIPFTLITVAENIFKHGLISDLLQPARLLVYEEANGSLVIFSSNKRKPLIDNTGLKSGLANLKYRLDAHYMNKATLVYDEKSDGFFILEIKIPAC
jgi:two-component system LytT family sensor kinase